VACSAGKGANRVKNNVKGSGQECPLHTGSSLRSGGRANAPVPTSAHPDLGTCQHEHIPHERLKSAAGDFCEG